MSGLHRVCCCVDAFCPCVDPATYTYYADCTSTVDWYKADCDCLNSLATSPGTLFTAQTGGYSCPQLTLVVGTSPPECDACKMSKTAALITLPIDSVTLADPPDGACTDNGFSYNSSTGGWTATVYPPDPSGTCALNYTDKWKAVVGLPGGVVCTYEAPYVGCSPPKAWTLVSTTGLPAAGCQAYGAWQIVNDIVYTIGTFTLTRV